MTVSREYFNRIAGRFGFNLPDKGDNYVRQIGRGSDRLRVVLHLVESDQRASMVTYCDAGPVAFHATTRLDKNNWESTLFRKVSDATVNGGLRAARRTSALLHDMAVRSSSMACPKCAKGVRALNTERTGPHWRCVDHCPGGLIAFRDGMGLDKRSAAEITKDGNVYETLVVRPSQYKLDRKIQVTAHWYDNAFDTLVVRGDGTFYVRRALKAFGLLWDDTNKWWSGPAGAPSERALLKQAVEHAGVLAQATNVPIHNLPQKV